ncbi:ankyrin repeat-containing protein BDA1-like [Senna tora]|uniref:Ankyrin repeat-containing protein BDA1-like n=1 Tax=Senna tora TaxID=362788 RepID=A0A835CAX4_9FABA|nr:ankyrin repeat-containing protein BDA1-like [Senna tora]
MDQRLVDAAREGDVDALYKVLEDDPLRLKKVCLAPFAESPLHVAALAGRVDFVKHMIALMPSLSTHTNLQGLIPLHMASAEGYVDIVKELLKVKQLDDDEDEVNQCLVKDNDGFTPLHYAIFRGKIGVIGELISSCAECVEEVTAQGDTVLHLAMKANQFGVVKLLMERLKLLHNFQDLLKSKNKEGKTVHQLASTKEQLQVLNTGNVDEPDRREENHIIVEEETTVPVVPEPEAPEINTKTTMNEQEGKKYEFQNTVIVVATLIVSLTYQGLSNPPSTIFKQGTEIHWGCLSHHFFKFNFINSFKKCPAILAYSFLTTNTIIFLLSILLMLRTLRGHRAKLLRALLAILIQDYCVLLLAFSYYTAYFAWPLGFIIELYIFIEPLGKYWRKALRSLQRCICRASRTSGKGPITASGAGFTKIGIEILHIPNVDYQCSINRRDKYPIITITGSYIKPTNLVLNQSHNITGTLLFQKPLLLSWQFKESMNRSLQVLNNLHGNPMINDLEEPPLDCSIGNRFRHIRVIPVREINDGYR